MGMGLRQISSSHVFNVIERHIECVGQFQVIVRVMTTYHLSFLQEKTLKTKQVCFK